MMKRTKENNKFKIENCVIAIKKATKDGVVIELVGKECNFKTIFRLRPEHANQIYSFVDSNCVIKNFMVADKVKCIQAKHREYTKLNNETEFTYKYYESENCSIDMVSIGGHCILSLHSNEKEFRTISFEVHDHIETFNKMKDYIKHMIGETMMNEW